jgi:hypothetical protein
LRVVIKEVVALQFEKRLRYLQLPHFRHGMRHMVKLRRIVDRPKESGQIVEKGVVASADENVDRVPPGRLHARDLVGRYGGRKASAWKTDEAQVCPVIVIDRYSNLRRLQYFQILLFDPFEVGEQAGEARIIAPRTSDPAIGCDQYPVQHVSVEDTSLRCGRKGQRDYDFFSAGRIVGRKAKDVVEIGGTDIDIREDRIYSVRVVMICHNFAFPVRRGCLV